VEIQLTAGFGLVALLTCFACYAAEPAHVSAAGNAAAGAQWYPVCASCHGEHGEGIVALSAPRLADLPLTYVIRQLQNFKSSARGSDPSDTYGQQMASMAALLPDADAVNNVAAFVGKFASTPASTAAPAGGHPTKGIRSYQTCSACHGAAGEGSALLGAPPLAGQSSAYLLRQLKGFKDGHRGGPRDSALGQQMAAAAASLQNDESIDNVVAYIATIRPVADTSFTR
jgi:cytochrome c oxidase subunit 2